MESEIGKWGGPKRGVRHGGDCRYARSARTHNGIVVFKRKLFGVQKRYCVATTHRPYYFWFLPIHALMRTDRGVSAREREPLCGVDG